MSSVLPPPTLSQETGTPAHEWAQETVGAVGGAADNTQNNTGSLAGNQNNTATTPVTEPPGAFPRTASSTGASTTGTLTESAQSALASAQQQAAPAVQSAAQTASGVFASAGQAARQYLPTSVVGTLESAGVMSGSTNAPTHTTLPSRETDFTPSAGGVGSLPGTRSEADVAKLPEERALENKIGGPVGREGALGADSINSGVSSSIDPGLGATEHSDTPSTHGLGRDTSTNSKTAAQPFSLSSPLGHAPNTTISSPGLDTASKRDTTLAADSTGMPRSGTNTSPDDDAQAAGRNKPLPSTTSAGLGNTNARNTSANVQSDVSHTEPVHSTPSNTSDSNVQVTDNHPVHEDHKEGGEAGGKPGLKQKIKGEVKVLAGRIGKDSKKVEEGKAMKEGHPA